MRPLHCMVKLLDVTVNTDKVMSVGDGEVNNVKNNRTLKNLKKKNF